MRSLIDLIPKILYENEDEDEDEDEEIDDASNSDSPNPTCIDLDTKLQIIFISMNIYIQSTVIKNPCSKSFRLWIMLFLIEDVTTMHVGKGK